MSEPSVEEIVSEIEAHIALGDDYEWRWRRDNSDLKALIASWRERGEALAKARPYIIGDWDEDDVPTAGDDRRLLEQIDAALKAVGEK